MQEIWKDVSGYEGMYQVSNLGRVKSLARDLPHKKHGKWHISERILKPSWSGPADSQYLSVFLHSGEGKQHKRNIHRLVAETFLDRIDGKEVVNHIDCNRANNAVTNLEWCTPLENTRHAMKNGRCDNVGKTQCVPVVNVETGEVFESIKEAAENNGVTPRAIWQVLNNKSRRAAGYHWRRDG